MPIPTLSIVNFLSGSAGNANGSSNFTDLTGKFGPSVVGSSLGVGGALYPITKVLSSTTITVSGTIPLGSGLPWSVSSSIANGQSIIVNENPTMGYVMEFLATASENSPSLSNKQVTLDFDYGIGSAPSPVQGIGYVEGTYSMRYPPGIYRVTVKAANFKYPNPQSKSLFFNLTVVASNPPANKNVPFSVVGPVLPADYGYPDAEEWNLNIDIDDKVITSNVKMLITTAVGERVMNPSYGTSIRTAIFDMDPHAIQTFLQNEITTALATFEPRAQLVGFTFDLDSATKTATLNLQVLSTVTRQVLPTPVILNG